AYSVGKRDNPICRINDNAPSAEPSSLFAALSPTSTLSGAPSKIPKPIPASTLATIDVPSPSTQDGKKQNPITPIQPAYNTVFTAPCLSVRYQPSPAPSPDASAIGVSQYPAFSAGTCKTCCTNDGIKIIPARKPPDKRPKIKVTWNSRFLSRENLMIGSPSRSSTRRSCRTKRTNSRIPMTKNGATAKSTILWNNA